MKPRQIIEELDFIADRLKKLRLRNGGAPWLVHILRSAETIIKASKLSIIHVTKATK